MCRQVWRRLDIALGGELENAALQGLWVNAVFPEPGGNALVVEVIVDDPTRLRDVMRALDSARGYMRSEVAHAIHRKRAPHLRFIALPLAALEAQEDDDA